MVVRRHEIDVLRAAKKKLEERCSQLSSSTPRGEVAGGVKSGGGVSQQPKREVSDPLAVPARVVRFRVVFVCLHYSYFV